MDLRLTVIDPHRTGASVEVVINAAPGTPLSAVAYDMADAVGIRLPTRATGGRPQLQFSCERTTLDQSVPLGLPPLLDGAVLTVMSEHGGPGWVITPEPPTPGEALLELHIIAGPDAGGVIPLTTGRHSLGRASSNPIRIADPDVSRVHAELSVSDGGITLRDRGSRNGTWIAARRVDPGGEPLGIGDVVRLGASQVAVRTPDRPPAAGTLDGEGHLRINRSPHLGPLRPSAEIRFPSPRPEPAAARLPWPTMLLPLLLAVPMSIILKQPNFALFAVMTPVLMLGQYAADRRSAGREKGRRSVLYREAEARSRAALEVAVATDAAYLEADRPDLARLSAAARTPTDELWQRTATGHDFLALRLGRGAEPAAVAVHRPPTDSGPPDPRSASPATGVVHPDVPISVNLLETTPLGVCGPRPMMLGLARSLVGQLAVLHSPADIRIEVIASDAAAARDWSWLDRIPHHQKTGPRADPSGADPSDEEGLPHRPPTRRVIVLDGVHRLLARPEVAAVLRQAVTWNDAAGAAPSPWPGGTAGAGRGEPAPLLICLDRTEQHLPAQCRTTVLLDVPAPPDLPGRTGLIRRQQATALPFSPDLASRRWIERLSRQLAPLRDATGDPELGLPETVRLVDVLMETDQVCPTDPSDLARHWQRSQRPAPVALLGVTATRPFRIDLCRDGPHLLVGGTTGAGKSELLQTLVASLAVGSGPDAISFLLIDYKGGAAFRECATLPHVGGIITDLDPHLARRALTSLTAELRRRERQLGSARAVDIDTYSTLRSHRRDLPAMPRLVVIVDEFRVLAEDLPEFVTGLIRTATVGRSLGVHLVLATQRPGGVVSNEIRANVNLRIALRVRDGADSRDLIDDTAAARLPVAVPGRALARGGGGPLISFQTARVSGTGPAPDAGRPVVRRLERQDVGWTVSQPAPQAPRFTPPTPLTTPTHPSDLAAIAEAARDASASLRRPAVPPPWLPPLSDVVTLDEVLNLNVNPQPDISLAPVLRLPFGLIDLPDEQRQEVLAWRLNGTNLAVAGGPRSGRTTVLRTLILASGLITADRELHLYVVDGAGGLAHARGLPNVDAVLPAEDVERGQRLLRRLNQEISTRQNTEPPESVLTRPDPARPDPARPDSIRPEAIAPVARRSDVVVLIDGWEGLTSAWNEVDHGRMLDQLIAIVRDGPAVGVFTAISGGRSLLTGGVSSLLAERVVLRFADPADGLLAGVPAAALDRRQPAGRGVLLGPDRPAADEVQIAVTTPETRPSTTPDSLRPSPLGRPGWRIPELARQLDYRELLATCRLRAPVPDNAHGRRRAVPIGIGGEDAVPVDLDLEATPITLVVGPPGSGRTSTLRGIAAGLARSGEPVLVLSATDPGHLAEQVWPEKSMVLGARRPDAAEVLAEALARHPEATVLLDNDLSPADPRVDDAGDRIGERLAAHLVPGRPPPVNGLPDRQPDTTSQGLSTSPGNSPENSPGNRNRGGRLVIASTASEVLTAYRGILAVARTARSGLLLGAPAPGDGEVFGLRLGQRPPGPPGRALLIQSGQFIVVQLALPPDERRPQRRPPGTAFPQARVALQ